jgi:hypothetical protein
MSESVVSSLFGSFSLSGDWRKEHESTIIGQKDVHQLQDHQAQGHGACDL